MRPLLIGMSALNITFAVIGVCALLTGYDYSIATITLNSVVGAVALDQGVNYDL
jgi:energy-converting hydrogenase Eha subunit E